MIVKRCSVQALDHICHSFVKFSTKCAAQKSAYMEISTLIWFHCMKKKDSSMEDKMKDTVKRGHTCLNPERYV